MYIIYLCKPKLKASLGRSAILAFGFLQFGCNIGKFFGCNGLQQKPVDSVHRVITTGFAADTVDGINP